MSKRADTKNELIRAGIHELRERGISEFSIRRVAAACGVSCAAPYRHFKNKDEFISAIYKYINRRWFMEQNIILSEYSKDRDRLMEMSVGYIRFLLDNPEYLSIILLHDEGMTPEQLSAKTAISSCARNLAVQYGASLGLSEKEMARKTYIIKSLILGAALMLTNRELDENEATFEMIRNAISQELP